MRRREDSTPPPEPESIPFIRVQDEDEVVDMNDESGNGRIQFQESVDMKCLFEQVKTDEIEGSIKQVMGLFEGYRKQASKLERAREKECEAFEKQYWEWRAKIGILTCREDGWAMRKPVDAFTAEKQFTVPPLVSQQLQEAAEAEKIVMATFAEFAKKRQTELAVQAEAEKQRAQRAAQAELDRKKQKQTKTTPGGKAPFTTPKKV
mmetsp:Transcript_16027/g.31387  ORF Transcript_16027/g.31387 Transcript_16027/m.31387 type:complete len:206 (-) Transcript_16027:40-657(-)